jgi:hypothetical protein
VLLSLAAQSRSTLKCGNDRHVCGSHIPDAQRAFPNRGSPTQCCQLKGRKRRLTEADGAGGLALECREQRSGPELFLDAADTSDRFGRHLQRLSFLLDLSKHHLHRRRRRIYLS